MTKLFNIGTKVTINHNAERLLDELLTVDSFVKVGILQDGEGSKRASKFDDAKKYRNKKGRIKKDKKAKIGQIGFIHEFGRGKVPQRSFLRSTWEQEKITLSKTLAKLAKREAKKDNPDVGNLLKLIGVYMVGKVKRKFTTNDWPPLKDPTRGGRNKEGGATPLVDTVQLRQSITYKIVERRSLLGRFRR